MASDIVSTRRSLLGILSSSTVTMETAGLGNDWFEPLRRGWPSERVLVRLFALETSGDRVECEIKRQTQLFLVFPPVNLEILHIRRGYNC
jgi:hypothetical protein